MDTTVDDLVARMREAGMTASTRRVEARRLLRDITATIRSVDRSVTVVMSATGHLESLTIAPGTFSRWEEHDLARMITATIREAGAVVSSAGRQVLGRPEERSPRG